MKHFRLLAAVTLAFASPATAVDTQGSAGLQQSVEEGARWIQKIDAALALTQAAYQQAAPRIQALTATKPTTAADAKQLGAKLRALIPPLRDATRQSNVALDQVGPPPALVVEGLRSFGMAPGQIIADAHQQNSRMELLYAALEGLAGALAAGDGPGVIARLPAIMTGAFDLLESQAMMIRNRQLLVPASESLHQSLGVQSVIYWGMSTTARAAVAIQFGAAKPADLAAARDSLEKMAQSVARLSMDGRRNVEREKAEFEKLGAAVARGGTAEQKTVLERSQAVIAIENEAFAVADDLYAILRQSAARLGQPKPTAAPLRPQLQPYEQLEERLGEVLRRQAAAMAGTP